MPIVASSVAHFSCRGQRCHVLYWRPPYSCKQTSQATTTSKKETGTQPHAHILSHFGANLDAFTHSLKVGPHAKLDANITSDSDFRPSSVMEKSEKKRLEVHASFPFRVTGLNVHFRSRAPDHGIMALMRTVAYWWWSAWWFAVEMPGICWLATSPKCLEKFVSV